MIGIRFTCWPLLAAALLVGCPGKRPDAHADHAPDEHGHEPGDHEEEEGGQGHDHGPPGESSDEVTLTREQLDAAKITVATASVGSSAATLRLTAVVGPDLDAQLHVTPKVPGVVRSISKQLGDAVAKGDVLCELDSVELGQAVAEWVKERTLLEAQRAVLAQEEELLGRRVTLAKTLLEREETLRSQEIGTVRTFYEAQQKHAEALLERDRRLLELHAGVRQLEVAVAAARSRLEILGLDEADLARIEPGEESLGRDLARVQVRAAAPGVVVRRHATLGEYVDTSGKLFELQDLTRVWVEARVFEKDLRLVRTGQRVTVRLDAFPGVTFEGEVGLVETTLDRESRAVVVRVVLENPRAIGEWREPNPIRPGMFGSVDLVLEERAAAVVLDESAVVHEGSSTYVFVRESAGEKGVTFHRRQVEVRDAGAGRVEVTSGLKAGEVVATSGLFTLKSVARQGELGGGHSH